MSTERADDQEGRLNRFREFLVLLARYEVSPRLRAMIDLSGVVQQSLIDAYRSPPQARTEPETAAWLRAVFRNNVADEVRRRNAGKRTAKFEHPIERIGDPPAGYSSPSQRAIRAEEWFRLTGALSGLPELQRRAIELHHIQGRSLAEIAQTLGLSKPAVAGLLHRGLKTLRARLSDGKEASRHEHRSG